MKKYRILYLLHTDWYWIKQRSQFLAEALSNQGNRVDVLYKYSPKGSGKTKNSYYCENIKTRGLFLLPFKAKLIPILKWLDELVWGGCLSLMASRVKYDVAIVTHPLLYGYVKKLKCRVIYDFHDDNAEFYSEGKFKNLIIDENAALLEKSIGTVYSSGALRNKFSADKNDVVIRNAHGLELESYSKRLSSLLDKPERKKVFYFGTVSEWFDFEMLEKALLLNSDVEFHIIGPSDVVTPNNPRIILYGAMEHSEMIEACAEASAFIMPFKITPLIEGVDPVKVYEYLSFPVPVFIPYYNEVLHFGDLVEYYNNEDEFNLLLKSLCFEYRVNADKRIKFLQQNSWECRSKQLLEVIALNE